MEKFKKVSCSEQGVTLDVVFDGQQITASLKGNNGYGDEIEVKGKYTSSGESEKSRLISTALTIWTEAADVILNGEDRGSEESAQKMIRFTRKGATYNFVDSADKRKIKIMLGDEIVYQAQQHHKILMQLSEIDLDLTLFEVADTLANLLHKR